MKNDQKKFGVRNNQVGSYRTPLLKALLKFVSENIGAKKSDGRKTVFKNNFALDDEILAIITYFSLINILFSDI